MSFCFQKIPPLTKEQRPPCFSIGIGIGVGFSKNFDYDCDPDPDSDFGRRP